MGMGRDIVPPPLRELRVKRLVCFWRAQWIELKELANSKKAPVRKYRKIKRESPGEIINYDILLADIPTEEPERNLWEVLPDEQHLWGDLSKEEELKVILLK